MKTQFALTQPRFKLIGHRGVSSLAPENTLVGFQIAKKLGLSWVEFDLQLTEDGHFVIFHDDTLERTSNGKGAIHDHTLEAIQALDAGSWFHSRFAQEKTPVFEAMIPHLNRMGLMPNIEIKIAPKCPFRPEYLAEKLINTLSKHWPIHQGHPLISSFEHTVLYWIRQHAPQYPLGFLFENLTLDAIRPITNLENISIHFQANAQTDLNFVKKLALQFTLIPYTINDLALGHRLWDAGCFAIFSDYPQKFIASAV